MVIALVDDDLSVRRGLGRLLRSAGHEVRAFASARDLLDSGFAAAADCWVFDIYLGGTTGFELHGQLAASGVRRPVIFITAHDDQATRRTAARVDGGVYLRKPFDANALLEAIEAALRTRAAERAPPEGSP